MTVTLKPTAFAAQCPDCGATETVRNRDSFIVCKACGLIIDDHREGVYHHPYHEIQVQHHFLGKTQIGSISERRCNEKSKELSRLQKLDQIRAPIAAVMERMKCEIERVSSALKLPSSFNRGAFQKAKLFYSQLKTKSKARNIGLLSALAIFFEAKEEYIILNKEHIYPHMKCGVANFKKYLVIFLQNNKEFKRFKEDAYRKELILKSLSGINDQFHLFNNFMNRARKSIDLFWNALKSTKNSVIVGVIYKILTDYPLESHVYKTIGVSSGGISNYYRKIRKMLNKEAGVMRKLIDLPTDRLPLRLIEPIKPIKPRKFHFNKEAIEVQYNSGKSIKAVAEINGCSKSTMRLYMIKNNIPIRAKQDQIELNCIAKKKKSFSALNIPEIIKRYENGETSKDIARGYGCHFATILRLLNMNNIDIRKRKYQLDIETIKRQYVSEGMTLKAIAEEYGCSYLTIRHHLIKAGVEMNRQGPSLSTKKELSNKDLELLKDWFGKPINHSLEVTK